MKKIESLEEKTRVQEEMIAQLRKELKEVQKKVGDNTNYIAKHSGGKGARKKHREDMEGRLAKLEEGGTQDPRLDPILKGFSEAIGNKRRRKGKNK